MRVSKDEKDRSHIRIVKSAARLFRETGLEGSSVGDVMKDAGLTHGGFYRHFESKDELVAAALDTAFADMVALLDGEMQRTAPEGVRETFRAWYLSDDHLNDPGTGCPGAALGGELGRGSPATKAAFSRGLDAMLSALALAMEGSDAERRDAAVRELSMMLGALTLARASDSATAKALLSAFRSPASA